jgi:SAM-dependent methyltransferase
MKNHEHIRSYYKKIGLKISESNAFVIKNIYLKNILVEKDVIDRSILEVGAGGSQFKEIFIDWGCDKYTGVELISSRIPVDRRSNVSYYNIPFENFTLDEKFDIIFFSLTYMYMEDRASVQKNIVNLLKKGGKVIFLEPNSIMPFTFYRFLIAKFFKDSPLKLTNVYRLIDDLQYLGLNLEYKEFYSRDLPFTNNMMLGTNFKLVMKK